ncbi:C3 and PZP-like alpha-2-macroglobulin domain-containing protein 8 [Platysternon megacephalum]|uniref:C3 and PZP-like alpha-2-macroglobulin domain-containing protein 8 n=1 Tax=Platysternon megacephalum TaxID=55544 RepID=A0A4D9EIH2_9SAUR|nr:C3 and PZP-like alpha-2-macroglobulin domain-containing protein 8 [Platysternon megacephalum]
MGKEKKSSRYTGQLVATGNAQRDKKLLGVSRLQQRLLGLRLQPGVAYEWLPEAQKVPVKKAWEKGD